MGIKTIKKKIKAFIGAGAHPDGSSGRCAMEWVSYLASQPHNDHPQEVAHDLNEMCIHFNDTLDDATRQRMLPYLPRLLGTAGYKQEYDRGYVMVDFLTREYLPLWLDKADYKDMAQELRALPEIKNNAGMMSADCLLAKCSRTLGKKEPRDGNGGAATGTSGWQTIRGHSQILDGSCSVGYGGLDEAMRITGKMVSCAYDKNEVNEVVREGNEKAVDLLDRMLPPEPLVETGIELVGADDIGEVIPGSVPIDKVIGEGFGTSSGFVALNFTVVEKI